MNQSFRNSIYNAEITHIYSTTRYSEDLTLEEFKENTKQNLNKAVKLADEINQVSEGSREIMFSKIKYMNEKYVRIVNNRLIVDKNFANIDIVNFKITKQVYKTGVTLCDELMKNGFNISVRRENEFVLEDLGCFWWGRQCSGQAIYMDSVISDIVKGFN